MSHCIVSTDVNTWTAVLLKLKPGVTEDQAARLQGSVLALKDTIPGILKASVGKDFISRDKGFDIGKRY